MARLPGRATRRKRGSAGPARQAAAWLAAALLTASAAGCAASARGSTDAPAGPGRACRVGQPAMLAALPGFVSMIRQDFTQAPGDRGLGGHPSWDMTQYVCGDGSGFISDAIMYGRYRAQDNALARSLGYRVGKFPLVPYVGTAVSALPHQVLEVYETALQFRSAKAAAAFLGGGQPGPAPRADLTGLSLPENFLAHASMAGPNDGRHEHRIAITGRSGVFVITLGVAGGKDLAWSSVRPIWARAYQRLTHYLT
jgi:hypothetical protein